MRRSEIQILHEILLEIKKSGDVPLTSIQLRTGLAYDRLLKHLAKLEKYGLIKTNPLALTKKGNSFVTDADKVRPLALDLIKNYFQE
jgi:predicted transcriptional regulator